jgi:hypothetical protein
MYAVDAGAVVLEYTANNEYDAYGNTKPVLENALVLPLKTILPPDQVPDPVMVFD